jgi:hypothetical protein
VAAARTSLMHGQTGQAREALDTAETQLPDRSIAPESLGSPVSDGMVVAIANARQALGDGRPDWAMKILDGAFAR